MKRSLLILLLITALGAGAYVYINETLFLPETGPPGGKQKTLTKTGEQKPHLTLLPKLFPANPVLWLHVRDLAQLIKHIEKSNFYKQAVEYKIFDPSKSLPVNLGMQADKEDFISKISSHIEKKTFTDFLGQEAALSLYPPDEAGKSHFLLAAKIGASIKIQEKFNRMKDSLFGDEVTVSEKKYNDIAIITYQSKTEPNTFHYAITKDHFVGSSSDVLLKKAIDLANGKESSLFIQSAEFNSLFKTSDLSLAGLLFIDIEKSASDISSRLTASDKITPQAIEETKSKLQLLKYLGFTFKVQKGLEIRSSLVINSETKDNKLLQAISLKPEKLKSLSFIPENIIFYGANVFEPTHFFEQFRKELAKKPSTKKTGGKSFGEMFNEFTGVSLEKDIVPVMGHELFFSIAAGDMNSPLPIPLVTIGIEIKSKEKMETLLKKIQARLAKSPQQKPFQKEAYKGYEINSLPLPIPIPVLPGYSIVNDFLLVSTSPASMKMSIDTLKGEKPSLQKNKKYIVANIPAENNGMFFLNATLLRELLSEVATKSPIAIASSSPDKAIDRAKSLELAQVVESINSVFIYDNNRVNSRTFIALKDIAKVRTNQELLASLKKAKQGPAVSLTPPEQAPVKTGPSPGKPLVLSKPLQTETESTYVYIPGDKRDPFQSLITGRQTKKEKLVRFFGDIKSLQPINLYIYNKIKRKDPVLYNKLRSSARFFKSKKELQKMSQEKRTKRLEEYKKLISIANTNFHDTILGPLQRSPYATLKLTGIIWSKLEYVALVETPDGKGYSIKTKARVGPNYGVVKEIEKDKVIIVEKHVDYRGKITSKQQEIKLIKSQDSL